MQKPYDVLVIGGGIIGLTAALAMAARDFTVAVIDKGSFNVTSAVPDPRVFAINQASRALFEQLDVWSLIDSARISPYQRMHVWDAANGACIDFDARTIAEAELGVILEESAIKEALLKRIATSKNITCFPENSVARVVSTEDVITVEGRQLSLQGRLLIVADGGESHTRSLLKVAITTWPYHQHAVVATVTTEKAHQKTAWQVFNADGPLAFLPLNDSHQCSIVWSTTPKHANHLTTMSDNEFNDALAAAFAGKLGKVALQSKRYQFPLTMRHVKHYVGHNWILMGDAAHTIHPLAGLGLNVGLADITSWLACLDASSNRFSKKALSAYQRQRKYAVWQIIGLMSGLKTLFANPLPPIVVLRGLGLGLCNRLSPLKRLFIAHAAGS
ncbi:MAG: FAD-dependent oxidoreductase [Legionella sp.]|nr:FAD-dependent oxidoreductase [Legionella sp.]